MKIGYEIWKKVLFLSEMVSDVLGKGQRVVWPVFAFFVGDYPAQLRARNFMGSQCKFACVTLHLRIWMQ